MIALSQLAAEALGSFLAADMKDRFGGSHALLPKSSRSRRGSRWNASATATASTAAEYSNFIIACLAPDIGYVCGVVKGDGIDGLVVDATGRKVALPRGSSDAALAPYHVERSKLFVLERLAEVEELDGAEIAGAIEHTRFPFSSSPDEHNIGEWAALRAADLVGQLGDPHYLRKANALYYEFEEIGLNR